MYLHQVGLANEDGPSNDTYRSLLANLPGGQIVLEESYDAMEKIMKEVISYTDVSFIHNLHYIILFYIML